MAKNKYKFGKSEIDLEQYINELGSNVDSYLESTGWGEELKKQFRDAYNLYMEGFLALNTSGGSRFYTNDFGDIYDTEGKLGSQDGNKVISFYYDNKGQRITPDEYNQLKDNKKKKYRAFSATSSFANYAKKVGKKLASSQSQESKEPDNKFSFAKHGFLPTWLRELLPAGGLWSTALFSDMDKANGDGIRGTTERAAHLAQQLLNYSEKLGDYDYSETPYGTKEEFRKRIQEAVDSLLNGYDASDTRALSRIGIGEDFLSGYFLTGGDKKPLTGIEAEIEELEKKGEEDKKLKELEDKLYNLKRDEFFSSIPLLENPITGDITTFSEYENDLNKNAGIEGTLNALIKANNLQNLSVYDRQSELKRILESKFPYIVGELRKGNAKGITPYLKALHTFGSFGTPDSNGYVILPNSVDLNRKSYIAYNPIRGTYLEKLLDLSLELLQKMAYDAYDSLNKVSKKLEGGSIENLGLEFWNLKKAKEDETRAISREVKETGKSETEVRAENRKPSEELSGVDITRLATAGMDIASMISAFIPGYGTIASAGFGLGSTVGNIGADMADDSMSAWDTTKNALFGLGMDVLGLIPGWGASAKATKIVRVLKPVAKTALSLMSVMGMVNSANAFTKMLNNPSEMTVADWRDALAGIKAITGSARSKGTTVSNNRERGRNLVASNYVNVPVKSGKLVKLSEDLFRRLKKANGIEEQNKILKEVAPNEELGTEFISGTFSHLRHPLHRNPSIEKGTDYALIDWSLREYLPIGYTYDAASKQVRSKKWSNAWLIDKANKMVSSNLEESSSIGLFREKNPLYTGVLSSSAKTKSPTKIKNFDNLRLLSSRTNKLTLLEINLINKQRVKQGKEKLTQLEIQALNQRRLNRAGNSTDNSIQSRLEKYKKAKREGRIGSVEEDIKRANDELAEATLNTPKNKQILANQIADQRAEIAVARNAENVRLQQLRELAARILSRQIPDIPQVPLRGAAYASREKFYDKLFSDARYYPVKVVTKPLELLLVPRIPRRPSKTQHDSRLELYNRLFNVGPTKSSKGKAREEYKKEANAQKAALEYIDAAKKMSKEKELAKNMTRVKRELPHKQTDKKKKTSRDDKRTVKREEGGILKFRDGGYWRTGYLTDKGTPENAKETGTWGDYYDFDKILKEVPTKVTQDANKFITSMNNLNKIEQDNKLGFGLNINERGYADWNKEFNNTGFNHFFLYNEGLNDYLGPSTYNRHLLIGKLLGTYNSAEKALKINGQNVYFDGNLWVLAQPTTPGEQKLETELKQGEPEEIQNQEVKPRVAVSREDAVAKEAKQATSRNNGLSALGALRLWLANRANKKMTLLALDSLLPMYLNPVQSHRYVLSDLSAEMAGLDAMARLMNWSSKPMTSDISQNFALLMDAMVKGLEYVNQGRRLSNATLREMAEKAWLQELQNALSRNQIHNENLASAYKTRLNKSAILQAFENKQFTNWDTFLKLMEYDKLVANREKKAREDAMALKQFSKEVTDNLAAYDPKLSREAVQLYLDVLMGIKNPSTLSREEILLLRQATASANEAMDKLYSQRYGLARLYLSAKKGGKLDPNKDLDRFYKYLDSVMNRNEKALDRVSKSMYALYKRKSK